MFQFKLSRICDGQLSRHRDHNKVVKYGKKVESWHMESQPSGIRINKFLTQLDFFSVGLYIYGTDNKLSKFLLLTKMVIHALGAKGECSPLMNFYLVMIFFANSLYHQMEHDFCRILCASLRLLLFYICFCSLLINTRLVFILYFVSVTLRKGHRGLEYQCSFLRLSMFLFAFLIIRIETFGFSQIFCNRKFISSWKLQSCGRFLSRMKGLSVR